MALHDLMMGALFLRRSGPIYDALCDKRTNDYAKGVNNTPASPAKQFTQMEYWKPVYKIPAALGNDGRKRETPGSQHYQGKKPLGKCFCCNRPECRNCTHTKMANGDPVQSDEEVQATKEAKTQARIDRMAQYSNNS